MELFLRTTGSNKSIGGSHAVKAPELLLRNNQYLLKQNRWFFVFHFIIHIEVDERLINMGYKSVLCLSSSRLQLIEVVGMKYFENKWLCVNRLIN